MMEIFTPEGFTALMQVIGIDLCWRATMPS